MASLSSGLINVKDKGVSDAVLLNVAFPAFTSYTLTRSLTTTSSSKKWPFVYVVLYTWKSALEVAAVPLSIVKAPSIVVTSVSVGTI